MIATSAPWLAAMPDSILTDGGSNAGSTVAFGNDDDDDDRAPQLQYPSPGVSPDAAFRGRGAARSGREQRMELI